MTFQVNIGTIIAIAMFNMIVVLNYVLTYCKEDMQIQYKTYERKKGVSYIS